MLSGIELNYDIRHLDRINTEVASRGGEILKYDVVAYNFNELMEKHNINVAVLLSIDVEGSELNILKTIDFNTIKIISIVIVNNYRTSEFRELLGQFGYH